MTRGGFSRLLGPPIRRPVARKIKGKDSKQVKTFVSVIDGELEQFLKAEHVNENETLFSNI